MKNNWLITLAAAIYPIPAFCQYGYHEVRQLNPELCGKSNATISLPRDFSATFDQNGEATLFARNGAAGIHLRYSLYQIEEVCPLVDGRLVVFGDVGGGTSFYIVDRAHQLPLDTVVTYGARMSPDQRWIVYRKFFPRSTELPASDEYLLYDLAKSSTQNRPAELSPGMDADIDAGIAIYPGGWKNEPGDNIGAPESQRHGHVSPFFWAPDSRAIVFGDELEKRHIVFITLNDDATTAAFEYPFPDTVECADAVATANGHAARPTGLSHVEFGPRQATDRVILVDYEARGCNAKTVQLHADDFKVAGIEKRVLETPTHKAKEDK